MSPHKQSNAGFPDFSFRLLGGSPEWIAGMRLRPGSVAATVSTLTLCACVPYAGFPALVAAAVGCGVFYRSCEPLQLVLLPEQGAARFLARKVLAAWRNYFLFAVPYATVIVLRHPDTCWMAAGWASLAALALLQIVLIAATHTNSAIHDILAQTVVVDMESQMIFDSAREREARRREYAEADSARWGQ